MNTQATSTAVATRPQGTPQKASVINALAAKLECDPAKLLPMLKKTAFATCRTDEEFMAMCMVANTYNLNPILKEIYAFPGKGGNVMPIVGVDGWIKMMNSNPNFDGIEFEEGEDYCTATIYRKDRAHPIKATEWLAECMGTTEPWKRWPRRMLRHKAMVQCARIAFGFGGVYDEDEARRIASVEAVADDAKRAKPDATRRTNAEKLREALHVEAAAVEAHDAPTPEAKDATPAAAPESDDDLPY